MATNETIPFLSNERLSNLGISTNEVINAIETIVVKLGKWNGLERT